MEEGINWCGILAIIPLQLKAIYYWFMSYKCFLKIAAHCVVQNLTHTTPWCIYYNVIVSKYHVYMSLKGALYRIWCGVNRLSDSGVKVV